MTSGMVTFESSSLVDESTIEQVTATESTPVAESPAETSPPPAEGIAQDEQPDEQLVDDGELDLLTPEQQSELIDLIDQLCQANDDIAEAEDELAEVNRELTEIKSKATGINSKIEELKDLRQEFLDEICGFRDAAPRTVKAIETGKRQSEPSSEAPDEDGWRRESLAVALQYGTIEKFGPKKQAAMKEHGLLTVGDLHDWQARASKEGISLHELFQRHKMGIGVDSVDTIEDRMAGYVAKWVVQNQPPAEEKPQAKAEEKPVHGIENWVEENAVGTGAIDLSEKTQYVSKDVPLNAPAEEKPTPSKPPANPELDLPDPPTPKVPTPEPSAPSNSQPQIDADGDPVQEAIDVLVEHFKTNEPQRMLSDSTPWDFGNIAACKDIPMTDCPYPPESEEFVDWIAGHICEMRRREKHGRGVSLPGVNPVPPGLQKPAAKPETPNATTPPEPEPSYSAESDDPELPGIELDFDPMSL